MSPMGGSGNSDLFLQAGAYRAMTGRRRVHRGRLGLCLADVTTTAIWTVLGVDSLRANFKHHAISEGSKRLSCLQRRLGRHALRRRQLTT